MIELVYRQVVDQLSKLSSDNITGIALGIDNLMTIVSSQHEHTPVLIKNKAIKSINAKYNKLKTQLVSKRNHGHTNAKSRKRYNQISDKYNPVQGRALWH